MNIREEFSKQVRMKKYAGSYGLEIETEVKSHSVYPEGFFKEVLTPGGVRFDTPMPEWEAHTDNSLRNYGIEFVLKEPATFKDVGKYLDNFAETTEGVPFLKNAPATSVHVHVNMMEETFLTMANFLTLYTMFENLLTEFSGPLRRSNLFALPIRVAEKTGDNIVQLFEAIAKANFMDVMFHPDNVKYAAMNLAPLTKLGSLEIRCFRGTTDVSEIKCWVGLIDSMLKFSRIEGVTPMRILSSYRDKDIEFIHDVFGEYANDLEGGIKEDLSVLVERNLWYVAKIADCVPDWFSINDSFSKDFKTPAIKKKLSAYTEAYDAVAAIPTATEIGLMAQYGLNPPPIAQPAPDWFSVQSPAISNYEEEEDND